MNFGRSNVPQCMRYVVESSNVFYRFIFLRDSIKDSSRSNRGDRSFTSTTRKRPRLPFSSVYISVRFLRTRGTLLAKSLGNIVYHPMHRRTLFFWQSIEPVKDRAVPHALFLAYWNETSCFLSRLCWHSAHTQPSRLSRLRLCCLVFWQGVILQFTNCNKRVPTRDTFIAIGKLDQIGPIPMYSVPVTWGM